MLPNRDPSSHRRAAAWAVPLCCGAALACSAAGAAAVPSPLGPFSGRLSPAHSTAAFHIPARRPSVLSWVYRGPAVRFVIAGPGGEVDGPGITSPYRLSRPGRYTLTISSNTMAEGIYGPYRISFRLRASP